MTTKTGEAWAMESTVRIANAIRALRSGSAQQLSDRTAELGYRVTRAVIADLETGRRKFIPAHELVMVAAALGVSPAVLLTWGSNPDDQVDVLPGRSVRAIDAIDWYGGRPFPRYDAINDTLPPAKATITDLWSAARDREQLRALLSESLVRMQGDAESVLASLSDRLDAVNRRVLALQQRLSEWSTL